MTLHTYRFDNLDEIDQFFERYKLPQCIQYERDKLNTATTIKKIEFTNLKLLQIESPGPDGFTGGFYLCLKNN